MPNYRIPNNANNDANGMWKMNAVQRGREGDEWPDPHVPYTPSQYYIRTCTGYSGAITDGTSTNCGTSGNGTYQGSWGYYSTSNNADCIGFSHQYTGSSAANYKLNKISLGSGIGAWTGNFSNYISWRAKIYTGFGTATNTVIYDSGTVSTIQGCNCIMGLNWYSSTCGGYDNFFMLELPDGTGSADPLPALSWNTGYTVAFAYLMSSGSGRSQYNAGESNRVITLNDGSQVTQNHFASQNSMSDSSPFGASNGTSGGYGGSGQFPVLGYLI